jgi:hypothetical protein
MSTKVTTSVKTAEALAECDKNFIKAIEKHAENVQKYKCNISISVTI